MIEKLYEDYNDFHDAYIAEVNYSAGYNFDNEIGGKSTLSIIMICFNLNRDFRKDLIKIVCEEIISYKYEQSCPWIFETMIKEENGLITLDFFHESVEDLFFVQCKNISFEVLAQK